MDDTTHLVSDLLQKLAELDGEVDEYRRGMAQQFCRYSHQRLHDVPGHVSAEVERLVAEQFHNYPALSPSLERARAVGWRARGDADVDTDADAARSDGDPWPDHGRLSSPPPASPRDRNTPLEDGPRSPHDRECEFYGLFTPSYLPLLDAVQRPSFTPPLPPPVPEAKEPNSNQDIAPDALVPIGLPPRPEPVRQDTVSSTTSDDSVSQVRRSALRRSSSSSAKVQSPRRVRFDVEGEEVLPTSSPPVLPRASDLPSPLSSNPTMLQDESYDVSVIPAEEETGLLGSSPPTPKKITSTERLKAMARSSTEDTSTWEVVGSLEVTDDEEDELVMAGLNGRKSNDGPRLAANHVGSENTTPRINHAHLPPQPSVPLPAVEEIEEGEAAEETEDADALMMPPLSSFKDKKRFSPPLPTAPSSEATVAARLRESTKEGRSPPTESSGLVSEATSDEETTFQFDRNHDILLDGDDKTRKYIEEEEEEEEENDGVEGDATATAESMVLYSTSPAIPVTKARPAATSTPPPSSPPSRQIAPSAGSYRGKPFSISIVRDPELHRKAAEMGDFYTFVGSVDGRSGIDETSSYRPELTYFTGTPRSLSERLMREDMDETHQSK
ncbi:hypothetical protein GGS23DRAFT_10632 [Durotheca rogersii]|uniref:uncharacterized protein n=1 Tax=Durotheca rogersii TaxID=419775 RepID=UPI0022200BC6|nr:uncharacterized protein GGS23DRAFT_10632 [Durotheca rogersii]KAI5868086.1 hypothetical protein GGS23DRAFT_10632 [Durotheca rogersii]